MPATKVCEKIDPAACEWDRDDIYIPSPDEIRAACAAIQTGWTEAERARRARGQAGRQRTVPVSMKRFARMSLDRNGRDGWAA